jgi:hypothetical protein
MSSRANTPEDAELIAAYEDFCGERPGKFSDLTIGDLLDGCGYHDFKAFRHAWLISRTRVSVPQCPITPAENEWLNKLARDIGGNKVGRKEIYNTLCNVLAVGRGVPKELLKGGGDE